MRFLVDECLPDRLAKALRDNGHDAVHVSDVDLAGAHDDRVMAFAAAQRRILLSADTDFGELLASGGGVAPSFVLLRGFGGRPERRVRVLLDNLDQVEEYLAAGAIVVINETRIRVRALPVDRPT